jgi:hypothetical protein
MAKLHPGCHFHWSREGTTISWPSETSEGTAVSHSKMRDCRKLSGGQYFGGTLRVLHHKRRPMSSCQRIASCSV